jgi:hypothetical protein
LYERIQIPLLGAVLADESLTRQVVSLLERTRKLLKNDEAIVSDSDVQRGLALMDSLAQCETLAGLRRDMTTVRKLIKEVGGKSVRTILENLLRTRRRQVRKSHR